MLSILRRAALAVAIASAALLPLIALNLTHLGPLQLERFREPTWVLYGSLALCALLRRDRAAFAHEWVTRCRAILDHPHFFRWMSGTMLALYLLAAWARHLSFHTFSHDFSMIDEALIPRPHRPLLYSPVLGRSFLSEHFSPLLAVLVPVHALLRSPNLLVVLQPVALWSAVLVLRAILARSGVSTATTNLACLVYLNHPVQIATLQYLFHMECLLPVLVLSAFRYYQDGAHWKYAAAIALALSVKEDVGLYLAAFGVYAALAERRRVLGALTLAAGVAWTLFAIRIAMPFFAGPAKDGYPFLSRWSAWGHEPAWILAGFLTHPIRIVGRLLEWSYLKFFSQLLFVPFFAKGGVILFFIPWLLPATSNFWQQSSLGLYYGIPLLAFSAISGVRGLVSDAVRGLAVSRLAVGMSCAAIMLNVAHLSFPEIPRSRDRFLRELDAAVPDTATVQAMSCFYPVLGYRREKMLIDRGGIVTEEYAVLRAERTTWPLEAPEAHAIADRALASGRYENRSTVKGFYILRRVKPQASAAPRGRSWNRIKPARRR